jgi:glucose uptake protein GlcU
MLHLVSLSATLPFCTYHLHCLVFYFLCSVHHLHSLHSSSSVVFNCCTLILLHTSITFTSNNHTNLQQQQQQLLLFSVLCIYIFCAPCACNVLHSSACSNCANLLHLLSALRDLHRNSSASLVVFPSVF